MANTPPRQIVVPDSLKAPAEPGAAGAPEATWEPDPLIGSLVGGRYRVTAIIGRGGMGVVYDSVHEQLKKPAAIKIVSKDYAHDERVIERFMREAQTVAQLGHPNIVAVYDLGRLDDERPYLVMERLYGIDLHSLLQREGRMEPSRAVELLEGVAGALDLVHQKGIIHRDVKLENMLLARTDAGGQVVKILDFGIAAMMNPPASQPRITAHNMITGTPLYISPEAAAGLKPDHRTDIYALAVCAFLLLTGQAPFDADSALLIMMRKMAEVAPRLGDVAKDVIFPEPLEEVMARGLQRHPDDRYSSASAFVKDMRRVVDTTADLYPPLPIPAMAPPPTAALAVPDDGPVPSVTFQQLEIARWIRRNDVWTGIVVVAALVLIATLAAVALGRMGSVGTVEEIASDHEGEGDPAVVVPVSVEAEATAAAETKAAAEAKAADAKAEADKKAELARLAAAKADADRAAAAKVAAKAALKAVEKARANVARAGAAGAAGAAGTEVGGPKVGVEAEERGPDVTIPKVELERAQAATKAGMRSLVQGLIPQAIGNFREATLAAPKYAPAWRGLGLANEKLGRTKEAIESYRRYLQFAARGEDPLVVSEVETRVHSLERGP